MDLTALPFYGSRSAQNFEKTGLKKGGHICGKNEGGGGIIAEMTVHPVDGKKN